MATPTRGRSVLRAFSQFRRGAVHRHGRRCPRTLPRADRIARTAAAESDRTAGRLRIAHPGRGRTPPARSGIASTRIPQCTDPRLRRTRPRIQPFEFAPFGGGHRRCVGASLADYEPRIVLATILARLRLRLSPRYARGRVPPSVPHNIATGPHRSISFDVIA
ncbi:cytochrome P450 [Nocardia sp. NPDC051990]|uniref:cytochrome P450 n=1 Tax=Nocardia sp. NPDC051990 TaxID=3155285 RepID=UPI00341F48BE